MTLTRHQWCVWCIDSSALDHQAVDYSQDLADVNFVRCDCRLSAQRHLGLDDGHAYPFPRIRFAHISQGTDSVEFKLRVALGLHCAHAILVVHDLKHIGAVDLNVHGAAHVIPSNQTLRVDSLLGDDLAAWLFSNPLLDVVNGNPDPLGTIIVDEELAIVILHGLTDQFFRLPRTAQTELEHGVGVGAIDGGRARPIFWVLCLLTDRSGAHAPAMPFGWA